MKHLHITFLLTVLMSMVGAKTFAHDIEVKNNDGVTIYYIFINDNTELAVSERGGSCYEYSNEYSGNVVIPGSVTYNGKIYSVTGIRSGAFYGCTGLTSVTVPNSVTIIGDYVFQNCTGLTSVTIPNSVTSIGYGMFWGCTGLTSIPNSVTIIGDYAFYQCTGLTSVTIPNCVTSIGSSAFNGCSSLNSVTIPNSVTNIGGNAFENTAWYNNQPDGLVYAGKVAYKYKGIMPANTSIVLKEGTLSIADYVFQNCTGLTSVTIPNSVTSIDRFAFSGCSGLTSITIPNSVTSIGNYAFSECSSLTEVTVESKSPVSISPSTFSKRTNATLYVPYGCKTAYEVADYWKQFKIVEMEPEVPTTVEVTDISTMNNVIYIEPMEGQCGTQATISLKMKNAAAIRGFQFDLYLPQGVTVVKSSKGKIQGFLSEGRLPDEDEHTLTFSEQSDGAIRFLCSSQYEETFTGNDGEIATLKVNIADNMEDGEYPIQLKSMKLTENNISNFYETALVQSKLTVSSYVVGDISGDGVVDVSDYTGVANHIHGNTPEGFNAKAADVDGNNVIDVSDYTGIANIIHTGSIYGNSSNAPAMMLSPRKVNTDISDYDNVIYISPFTASAGSQTTISIKMKNAMAIRGFQFDLHLPEGMTVVKSAKGRIQGALSAGRLPDEDEHELTFSEQSDGSIRFLCSSQYDETFTGNDGEIAILQVNVASNMANGDYPLQLTDMKLTETDISKYYTADLIETTVTIGEVDTRVILDETSTTAPEEASNVDVRVKRTINANEWSTICLPFAMTAEQVTAAFGSGVKLGDLSSWESVEENDAIVAINVNFTDVTAIEANHPYIIKVTTPVTYAEGFTVDGVDIAPVAEPKVQVGTSSATRGWMYGTYVAGGTVPAENLFLNGSKFWYSKGLTTIKAFRGYFKFRDVLDAYYDNSSAPVFISFDGGTTSLIEELRVKSEEFAPGDEYYTLDGRLVKTPAKGVYIHNGKKIVVK